MFIAWSLFLTTLNKKILYVNTNSKRNQSWNDYEIKTKRYTISFVFDIGVQKKFFFVMYSTNFWTMSKIGGKSNIAFPNLTREAET